MIIQQADGKIENSDKRTERRTDGRKGGRKMESMIAVAAAHSQGDGNGMMRPFLAPPVWPVRRQIAMFVSG